MTRENGNCLSVSVTGIDGSGKTTAVINASGMIGYDHVALAFTNTAYLFERGAKKEVFPIFYHGARDLMNLAQQSGSREIITLVNGSILLAKSRTIEPLLKKRYRPEAVIADRHPIIDTAVYAAYYSPALRRRSMKSRFTLIRRCTGAKLPEELFYLNISPEIALSRIEKRVRDASSSEKRHVHEALPHLEMLGNEYNEAINRAQIEGTTVRTIDSGSMDQQEVSGIIYRRTISSLNLKSFGLLLLRHRHCAGLQNPHNEVK